jgi:GGDEF domain-containing protein
VKALIGDPSRLVANTLSIAGTILRRAEDLRNRIEALQPCNIAVTVSQGVTARADDKRYEDLFSRADNAMYRTKRTGVTG